MALQSWFPEKEAIWEAFNGEENANGFAQYLHAALEQFNMIVMAGGSEGRAERKADIAEWIKDVLDPMEKSSELRAKCFLTASDHRGDCVDNKKVGWYEMERIVADHQLAARDLPLTELYQESIPWAQLDVLHEEAYYLADARGHIKESLTYLLTLFGKEPIRALLPNRRITVCFPAYVSDTDVQRIAKKISGDDKDFIASFLLTSDAWKAALQRDFPKAYQPENFPAELVAQRDAVESELNERAKELEKLMEPPPEEQDDEGKAALAKQINSLVKRKESLENQIRHAINEKLTRELQEKIEPARQSD